MSQHIYTEFFLSPFVLTSIDTYLKYEFAFSFLGATASIIQGVTENLIYEHQIQPNIPLDRGSHYTEKI